MDRYNQALARGFSPTAAYELSHCWWEELVDHPCDSCGCCEDPDEDAIRFCAFGNFLCDFAEYTRDEVLTHEAFRAMTPDQIADLDDDDDLCEAVNDPEDQPVLTALLDGTFLVFRPWL